jgi:thioredoxin 1
MRAAPDAPIRTSASVLDRIVATGHPALIVFETPECGPCQQLRPVLDELAREFRDRALIVRVTDSSEGWLAARYHLAFVPTLLFCRDGLELTRIKGNPGRAAVRAHLEFLLTGDGRPDPAEGPRHTLVASFGGPRLSPRTPRALLWSGVAR